MYTVSILSRTTRQWRTIQVATLSEAVQLTLGLETEWMVENDDDINIDSDFDIQTTKRYKHAVRSLVARWKSKYFEPVAWFRLSDSELRIKRFQCSVW